MLRRTPEGTDTFIASLSELRDRVSELIANPEVFDRLADEAVDRLRPTLDDLVQRGLVTAYREETKGFLEIDVKRSQRRRAVRTLRQTPQLFDIVEKSAPEVSSLN